MTIQQVFRRTETKYLLTPAEYSALFDIIEPYLKKDIYFESTNCNLYFDTEEHYLAIHSLEHPLYKEKVRLRSYGIPTLDDTVFLELKKKYDGIGSKRRIPLKLSDFQKCLNSKSHHLKLNISNPQIDAELTYVFRRYRLSPVLYLAYDRLAYTSKDDPRFRITFDKNIRSRTSNLSLEAGDTGDLYFQDGEIVMEVKALDAYPLWFVRALSRLKIYPASFSKYGRIMSRLSDPTSSPPTPSPQPKAPSKSKRKPKKHNNKPKGGKNV